MATLWQQRVRAALRVVELTHAQFVLLAGVVWLEQEGAPVTQVQIAQHAKTDAVMTSEVLRTLEKKKLIRRINHPNDGRAKCVTATSAGRSVAKAAIAVVENADAQFFSEKIPELDSLTRLLARR